MGLAKVTHWKLINSKFCIFYVIMNHFEVLLMVSSRVVESKVYTQDGHSVSMFFFFPDEKAKWQMLWIRNLSRLSFWYESLYGISKSFFIQVTLNFEVDKWILIVDILTQIWLTLLTFIALPILRKISISRMISLSFELLCKISMYTLSYLWITIPWAKFKLEWLHN